MRLFPMGLEKNWFLRSWLKSLVWGSRNAIWSKLLLIGVRESSIPHSQQMVSLYFNIFSVYDTYKPRVCRMAHFCFSTAPKFRFVLTSSSYLLLHIFIHLIVSLPYSKHSWPSSASEQTQCLSMALSEFYNLHLIFFSTRFTSIPHFNHLFNKYIEPLYLLGTAVNAGATKMKNQSLELQEAHRSSFHVSKALATPSC